MYHDAKESIAAEDVSEVYGAAGTYGFLQMSPMQYSYLYSRYWFYRYAKKLRPFRFCINSVKQH